VQLALNWYGEQLLANTEPLVVTPETAIPVLPQQLSPPYWQALQTKYAPLLNQNQLPDQKPDQLSNQSPVNPQTALIGLPMGAAGLGYSNSALALGPQEVAYRYDKLHLVPFGEICAALVSMVCAHDEHAAGRLCARPSTFWRVAMARPAFVASNLLRRSVW
jgi:apolipoprotein N-acyltransferase